MNAKRTLAPRNRGLVKKLTAAVSANFQDSLEIAKQAGLGDITELQRQNALNYAARQGRIERQQINGRTFHYRLLRTPPHAESNAPRKRRSKNTLAAVVDMNGDIIIGKAGVTIHIEPEEVKPLSKFLSRVSKL